jgi:hypothetical protein
MPVTPTLTAHTTTSLTFDAPAEVGMTGAVTYEWFLEAGASDFAPAPVTVTLDDGSDGVFTPATLTFTAGSAPAAQAATYTPASPGAKSISVTNNGGLTDPAPFTYAANAVNPTCTVNVRCRDGAGNLVPGCQVRATLVKDPDTATDAILTQQVLTGTTASDGTMTLTLLQGHTYTVRGVDPALKPFLWREVTVPAADTANLWGLI